MPKQLLPWIDESKLNYFSLACNPEAKDFISTRLDMISWNVFSMFARNIDILEANQDKIDWQMFCINTAAIPLLQANPDKIDWDFLSKELSCYFYVGG